MVVGFVVGILINMISVWGSGSIVAGWKVAYNIVCSMVASSIKMDALMGRWG